MHRIRLMASAIAPLSIAEMQAAAAPITEAESPCIQHAGDAYTELPLMPDNSLDSETWMRTLDDNGRRQSEESCRRLNACFNWESPQNARWAYEDCLKELQPK
jgi:hypothetical protein